MAFRSASVKIVSALLMVCLLPGVSLGYSVLTHEAIIDSMWAGDIAPVLLKKYPRASADELREARAYAYGGAIIQDMGYYPFGSRLYSDLTHYVRSGDFIEALITDARDINEYAFAIGALSHYCADTDGHTIATNAVVPILYPKLRRKFGARVTFEQKPSAHVQTEFGFDVLQIAQGHYAPQAYHDFVGFKVAKPLLQRAFQATYGIELKTLFTDLDLALGTYRRTISTLIPRLTRIAWQTSKVDMANRGVAQHGAVVRDSTAMERPAATPVGTREKFLFNLSRADYDKEWGTQYQKPGFFSKVFAFLFNLVPKIGPFKNFAIRPSTPATELLFMKGFNTTTESYRRLLGQVATRTLRLENRDLDTGKPTASKEYGLADQVYARMLSELSSNKFESVLPALRANIVAFYHDTTMRRGTRKDSVAWNEALANLAGLRRAGGNH